MTILALDLSLTSTGYAHGTATGTIAVKSRGVTRLAENRDRLRELVLTCSPERVVMEGYANGKGDNYAKGMWGGVARLLLHDMGLAVVEVPPASLKKFATGKGNANKDTMLEAAIRRFGFQGHGNDEADAWLLLKMAEAAYDIGVTTTAYQDEALAKVVWR